MMMAKSITAFNEEEKMNKPVKMDFGVKQKQVWEMTPEEVQQCCTEGRIQEVASVGDTFGDGTFTYTIIGINQDIPCDENGNPFVLRSYRDVLTVMCLGASVGPGNGKPVAMDAEKTPLSLAQMNGYNKNQGSWKESEMRKDIMSAYFTQLPINTQNVIGCVLKVTGQYNVDTVYITCDKCFLLSGNEICSESDCTLAEANATFQYQYFTKIATTVESKDPKQLWWLRSPYYYNDSKFCCVKNGDMGREDADANLAVFPAFCIY